MARIQLLSPAQRTQLFSLSEEMSQKDIVHYYTFSSDDLAIIHEQREEHNQLGFAIQLAYYRFPGRPFQMGEPVPQSVLEYVAAQLHTSPAAFSKYGKRDVTRREHAAKIQKLLRYRQWDPETEQELAPLLQELALQSENGMSLTTALLEQMRKRKVILPAASTIEQFVSQVRAQAEATIFTQLTAALSLEQRERLDALLAVQDGRETPFSWLKGFPRRPSATSILSIIERITYLDEITLPPQSGQTIAPQRLIKLARCAGRYTAQHLLRLETRERHALLVTFLIEFRKELVDQIIGMHDKLIGQLFNRSERQQKTEFQNSGRAMNEKVRLYAKVGQALIEARASQRDWQQAIESVIPWERFITSVEEAAKLARDENFDYLDEMKTRYGWLRQYTPKMLETLNLQAAPGSASLLKAIDLIKELNRSGKRSVPETAPLDFVTARWEKYILKRGTIDRVYYEIYTLSELRNRLRSGDVWVEGSREYKDFNAYLLSREEWLKLKSDGQTGVALPLTFDEYIRERSSTLHISLRRLGISLKRGTVPDVRLEDSELHITPLEKSVPEEVETLHRRAYELVPRIKLTELLIEVDGWTRFSDYFTRGDDATGVARDKKVLLSAILADATNLGPANMASVCPGVSLKQLLWVSDIYLNEATYTKALREIVNFHHALPFASHWGAGTTSSSDGQNVRIFQRFGTTAQINARYGLAPSVTFYTHISDQYSPFYTKVINSTVRDATHVLDGLLYHETDLSIKEHYTDTAGFTDHVFALCHLLGFRFAPRIRDLADKKLYTIKSGNTPEYRSLQPLIGGKIQLRSIEHNWDELLRLAASIRSGTVTASRMLRKLGSYPRQNSLALALRELGRIERTLFTIDWLEQPELRQRALVGLNKGEARNALAKTVFFYRRGEVSDRSLEDQYNNASGLNLVVAAIILWNTVYLAKAIDYLMARNEAVFEHVKHLSPVAWDHISLTGDYIWNFDQRKDQTDLRQLRLAA
jgi:TnpA family transposase